MVKDCVRGRKGDIIIIRSISTKQMSKRQISITSPSVVTVIGGNPGGGPAYIVNNNSFLTS